ncbi:MAG: hypothetical protein FWD31_08145 [Planctomycetaceae bacterium]|nr:hypothetical protein [Planctomycetaceae bacterium]
MGLLDKGRNWINKKLKAESVTVTYFRDEKEIAAFLAGVMPPASPIASMASMVIAKDERDFIVEREDLKDYEDQYFLPQRGDKIVQVVHGIEKVFIVGTKNHEDHFIFQDGGETSIRIHATLWDSNEET